MAVVVGSTANNLVLAKPAASSSCSSSLSAGFAFTWTVSDKSENFSPRICKMMKYTFETNELGISDAGFHLLRNHLVQCSCRPARQYLTVNRNKLSHEQISPNNTWFVIPFVIVIYVSFSSTRQEEVGGHPGQI